MWDNGIGISEMLMIAIIALIVFGPEKFPEYAKIFLRAMRDIRGYVDEVKTDLSKEINPLRQELQNLNRQDPEKLLDALTGQTETKAATETPASPAASPTDTTESDKDSNPYPPGKAKEADAASAEASEPYRENQDFEYNKPPERLD